MGRKDRRAAKRRAEPGRDPTRDGLIWNLLNLATQHHRAGQLVEAERRYHEILRIDPAHGDCLNYLGILAHQRGETETALRLMNQSLEQDPNRAEYHYNIGLILASLDRLDQAAEHYQRALALRPDYVDAHNNLAGTYLVLERRNEAVTHYRHALAHAPHDDRSYLNLAEALLVVGNTEEALAIVIRGLEIKESQPLKAAFVQCLAGLRSARSSTRLRTLILQALTQSWCRPSDLAAVGTDIIKQNDAIQAAIQRASTAWPALVTTETPFSARGIAAFASDSLLQSFLVSMPVGDLELEFFLTNCRCAFLDLAVDATAPSTSVEVLRFAVALAQQCFINEYVFALGDSERQKAAWLRDALATALESGGPIAAHSVAAVASYFPLHSVRGAQSLVARTWPDAVKPLFTQQLAEPDEERRLRPTIPTLTPVDEGISVLVRDQYEENPYPRWIRTGTPGERRTFPEHLRMLFPHLSAQSPGKRDVDVLIAGCGTGQHSIETGQLAGTNVLAIDISLASLCYAKRKTRDLGMSNIDYARADILNLGGIGRSFDVIEAVGVLHHMREPLEGWGVLLSLLRDGGFMRVALYSARARADIQAARTPVAEHANGTSADDIRRFRQRIIARTGDAPLGSVAKRQDFFTVSGCRDLLFHVQEHQFELPTIKSYLAANDLIFIGFTNLDGPFAAEYRKRFPEDQTMTNLDHWDSLEREYPTGFGSMYRFWVQKP